MRDIDRALDDITSIRSHLAAGTLFRGFGPLVIAATGGLAVATALAQSYLPETLTDRPVVFLDCWVLTAVASVSLIGAEMLARSRRHHGGMADAMIWNAIQQFLPAGMAGAVIAWVLVEYAPAQSWMLPGLWQVLMALGLFASIRTLPRTIALVAAWYFLTGIGTLIIASHSQTLSPWLMGVPFGVGQFLMGAFLHFASGDDS